MIDQALIAHIIGHHFGEDPEQWCRECDGAGLDEHGEDCEACGTSGMMGSGPSTAEQCAKALLEAFSLDDEIRLKEARTEISALQGALEPFAKIGEWFNLERAGPLLRLDDTDIATPQGLTVGDFRRAFAVFAYGSEGVPTGPTPEPRREG